MENKINLAELLIDCPQGMELYSPLCGDCKLYDVNNYMIRIETPNKDTLINLYHDGRYYSDGEIMLFPKGKTTWEGFVPPCKFKDGDIIYNRLQKRICIYHYREDEVSTISHCRYNEYHKTFEMLIEDICIVEQDYRLATEEEKEKLFKAIKDNGFKWNAEAKTLEKLIEPKFKVGDKIQHKNGKDKNGVEQGLILSITDDTYDVAITNDMGIFVPIADQDEWELVPNKFDITTLKPFESRVLVRDYDDDKWYPGIWGFYDEDSASYPYRIIGDMARHCIPYEQNEHLLGTTDDCDEYFKTWE